MTARYQPGGVSAAVAPHLAVLAPGIPAPHLAGLLDLGPREVLALLADDALAPASECVAVVAADDEVVVRLRGTCRIEYAGTTYAGHGTADWREVRIPVASGEAELLGPDTPRAGGDLLPIEQGVVLVSRLSWRPPAARSSGDHDGRTITAEALGRLRGEPAAADTRLTRPPDVRPRVQASLTISTGESVSLARPVLIGRSPRTSQVSSAELPRLVVVDDPYVSGTHLEVRPDGDSLIAIDRSTNGTTLTRPDGQVVRLGKGQPTPLEHGCLLGLSDDVTARLSIGPGR